MKNNAAKLSRLVVEEFSGKNAQAQYTRIVENGFWESEEYFISKYFKNHKEKLLDLGCGTGRTTIPLHKMGFDVIGVDITPAMISSAKKIAARKKLKIKYEIGDATNLKFKNNTFGYILFSNQGWTQIPGKENRQKALDEMYRTAKKGGILIFTIHPRIFTSKFAPLWIKQWIRFYVLKPLGFSIDELDFGDRFFEREAFTKDRTYTTRQYIHIPSRKEVIMQLNKSGFKIIEINDMIQRLENGTKKQSPLFFVCQK